MHRGKSMGVRDSVCAQSQSKWGQAGQAGSQPLRPAVRSRGQTGTNPLQEVWCHPRNEEDPTSSLQPHPQHPLGIASSWLHDPGACVRTRLTLSLGS